MTARCHVSVPRGELVELIEAYLRVLAAIARRDSRGQHPDGSYEQRAFDAESSLHHLAEDIERAATHVHGLADDEPQRTAEGR